MKMRNESHTFWMSMWKRYLKHILGVCALVILALFFLIGIYAPLLASSKPLVVNYHDTWYFPLFRYLFYQGFYTKKIDLFFNLLMFTFPFLLISLLCSKKKLFFSIVFLHFSLFALFSMGVVKNPATDSELNIQEQKIVQKYIKEEGHSPVPDWNVTLQFNNDYSKLNLVLNYIRNKEQHEELQAFESEFKQASTNKWLEQAIKEKRAALLREGIPEDKLPDDTTLKELVLKTTPAHIITRLNSMPTLYQMNENNEESQLIQLNKTLEHYRKEHRENSYEFEDALARKKYIFDRKNWMIHETEFITHRIMPFLRSFHWEDDAAGEQEFNKYIHWWELTRINRKDMLAALIFGVRVSLVVGITAVALSLAIGVPIGAFAGFYGGRFDIVVSRLLEVWEAMPILFMLLLIVAITQNKSIFLIVSVIGLFGWTTFSRFVRGEFFKQRNLAYVESCRAVGFKDNYIIFRHILPNALPPLLTLLPFAVMGAITSEAALSFLGLGEEGSCSWGVLMDEGRTAFPGEIYLLWPPAILLTILLISIALVGDTLRDALDPKLNR